MSESRIISQCAPTLAGIKTGSLFPHPYDSKEQVYRDIRELNRRLIPKGLCLIPLRFTEKNVLLYLYRPAWLRRDLSDETACEVLREMGYTRSDCGSCLAQLMRRMHYMSFVSMFRSDLYEGLCVGHAPRKCAVCGKWFLTTDARYAKYCDGLAPGDKRGRTCRQVGNLRGREQRELAADHPIKKIYTKRFNTITQYLGRGTLDEQTAAAMKALAKSKLEKALQDNDYAQGGYAAEMEQAALLAEVKETMER